MMFGIFASASFSRRIASFVSTVCASCAVRSTRRNALVEKFWMVSEKTLLLPTNVLTLSGVRIVVAKSPISVTVPSTPPAFT